MVHLWLLYQDQPGHPQIIHFNAAVYFLLKDKEKLDLQAGIWGSKHLRTEGAPTPGIAESGSNKWFNPFLFVCLFGQDEMKGKRNLH